MRPADPAPLRCRWVVLGRPQRRESLAVTSLVDIHSHLLPGIDDGPDDLEGSLDMARTAAAAGVKMMAATPHLRADFPGVDLEALPDQCEALRRSVRDAGIALKVVGGAEASVMWALEASDEQLKLASYGQRGKDLLIETPNDVSMVENILFAIRSKGFRITLAHPERQPVFQEDPSRLERLGEQGVLLQINATALLHRRRPYGRLAEHLVRSGLVHAVSSDGHRASQWRAVTELADGLEVLSEMVGPHRARWLCSSAPAAILTGVALPPAPPIVASTGWRGWFQR